MTERGGKKKLKYDADRASRDSNTAPQIFLAWCEAVNHEKKYTNCDSALVHTDKKNSQGSMVTPYQLNKVNEEMKNLLEIRGWQA